jgi:hypothetical protein
MILLPDFLEFLYNHRTKGEVKAVAQGLGNDVTQDAVYYANLAMAQ